MPVISTSNNHNICFLSFEETKIVEQTTVDAIGEQLKSIAESTDEKKIIFDLLGVESMTGMVILLRSEPVSYLAWKPLEASSFQSSRLF